jgi:cytidylate kinase
MSVVAISRGSYSYGKTIAEAAAKTLKYSCIDRDALLEASKDFNLPEFKLVRAIQNAPSIFDRFVYGKEKYIAYIQAALLKHLQKDRIVYHGFVGHFVVKDIPHVLKVRINADMEDRVKILREREGMSSKDALRYIRDLDKQRKKWSKHMYGIDTWDSSLYDLVIQIGRIQVDDAVEIICSTAQLGRFQTTPESQQAMDDLYLSAKVKAALIDLKRDIRVSAQNGIVRIEATTQEAKEFKLTQDIQKVVDQIPGVTEAQINVISIPIFAHH